MIAYTIEKGEKDNTGQYEKVSQREKAGKNEPYYQK